jgi:hypothetical protein
MIVFGWTREDSACALRSLLASTKVTGAVLERRRP